MVRYATGGEDAGRLVADALGGLPVEEGAGLTAGTVQVYLGKDYSGPGRPRVAGASLRVDPGRDRRRTTGRRCRGRRRHLDPSAPVPPPPRPSVVGGKVPCVS